jgi:hypothetical protein
MRTVVTDGPDGLSFLVPARRQWFAMLFLPIWLVGWVFGEVFAIGELISGKGPWGFLLFWLAGWTVGGGFAIFVWLWMVAGRERLIVRPGVLAHRSELFSVQRNREYDLPQVRNLIVSPAAFNPWNMTAGFRMWGFGGGIVAFDYGARTIRVLASIDEAEGRMIVSRIQERCAIPNTAG